jgi:hypothetical protein
MFQRRRGGRHTAVGNGVREEERETDLEAVVGDERPAVRVFLPLAFLL